MSLKYVKIYQKYLDRLDTKLIQMKSHLSQCQQWHCAQHILSTLWVNSEYGVPTIIPTSFFWKVAKRFGLQEVLHSSHDVHIPLCKYSAWTTLATYSTRDNKPVPLELVIGLIDYMERHLPSMTSKQLKFFNQSFKDQVKKHMIRPDGYDVIGDPLNISLKRI